MTALGNTNLLIMELHMEFVFFMPNVIQVSKEIALASISKNILSKLDQQDTRKATAKLFPTWYNSPSKFPAT